jgi:hypothetical protein
MGEELAHELRQERLLADSLAVVLLDGSGRAVGLDVPLGPPTASSRRIAQTLEASIRRGRLPAIVRGVEIRFRTVGEDAPRGEDLFSGVEPAREADWDRACDRIRERFGGKGIRRGSALLGTPAGRRRPAVKERR